MKNDKKVDRKKQEDVALTRALVWFAAAMVLEFLLLLVDKYYINFSYGMTNVAIALGVVIKILAVAATVGAVLSGVWSAKRMKAEGTLPFMGVVITTCLLSIGVSSALIVAFHRAAVQMLCLVVPAGAVLVLVYYLYQREFFFSALGMGIGLLGLWLVRKNVGHDLLVAVYVVVGAVVLAALLVLVLKLKKNQGVLCVGGTNYAILPKKSNFVLVAMSCMVSLAAMVAGLLLGGTVAFYLLFVLLSWLCVLLVYYTVKMM